MIIGNGVPVRERVCDFILVCGLLLMGEVWLTLAFMLWTAFEDLLEEGEPPHYKLRIK